MLESQPARLALRQIAIFFMDVSRERALVLEQLRADVFETGKCFDTAQTKFFRDRFFQIGGDKGFNNDAAGSVFCIEDALSEERLRAVVSDQGPDLIAGKEFHFARRATHCNAHAIAIWISRNYEVSLRFNSQLYRQVKRFGVLWIRRFHGGKTAVEGALFRNDVKLQPDSSE